MDESKSYEEMSIEELDQVLKDSVNAPPPVEQAQPVPTEQPPPPPPDTPAPEAEQAPTAVEEPATPAAEAAPEVSEIDVLKAQIAEIEARAGHWERVAGGHAGRMGFLEKQLAERRAEVSRQEDPGEETVPNAEVVPRTDPVAVWATAKAMRDAYEGFVRQHPDYAEHSTKLQDYLQANGYNGGVILNSNDPAAVEREVSRMLSEHHGHVLLQQTALRKQELIQRRADQTAGQSRAKLQSTISASGSAPAPRQAQKTMQEMSLEELDKVMQEGTGGRW